MATDPASLNRAMYGNAGPDTIEKMPKALNVPIQKLFKQQNDDTVEGFIRIKGELFQFSSKEELFQILEK